MIPKPSREHDARYLDFVRSKPCICLSDDCKGSVSPHHTQTRGAGGSDYRTIPVCSFHHFLAHQKGLTYIEEKGNFNHLDVIIRLLSEYVRGGHETQ